MTQDGWMIRLGVWTVRIVHAVRTRTALMSALCAGLLAVGGCVRTRTVEAPGPGHPAYTDDTERYEPPRNMLADEASPPRAAPSNAVPGDAAHGHHGSHGVAVYQCPMHPEVRSDRPGACPKCGMALVKINETHNHGGGR